jgi:DNA-binding transcriptional MerR regulator
MDVLTLQYIGGFIMIEEVQNGSKENSKSRRTGQQFGISTQTIHWYEAQGLLPESRRSGSGYREYSQAAVDQIAFVRKALSLGFSVADIKEILALRERGSMPCEHVLELVDKKVRDITEQIQSLEQLRAQLLALQQKWSGKASRRARHDSLLCPIIEES